MKKTIILPLIVFLVFQNLVVNGQVLISIYNKASALYNQGHLEETIEYLENISINEQIGSKEDKIRAYELLTTTYLYLKETDKADITYLKILKLNPVHEVKPSDDEELYLFSQSFVTKPRMTVGILGGINWTNAITIKAFSTGNINIDNSDTADIGYAFRSGVQLGGRFSFYITDNIQVSTGFLYNRKNFEYRDILQTYSPENQKPAKAYSYTLTEQHQYFDFPIALKLSSSNEKLQPYIGIGGVFHFFRKGEINIINPVKIPDLRTLEIGRGSASLERNDKKLLNRTTQNISISGMSGLRYRFGLNYLFAELSYGRMVKDALNTKNRFSSAELIYVLGHIDDNFVLNTWQFSIGFLKTFYHTKKYY